MLKPGFHFVPEGRAIVARRFIAGLAINNICVPEGRLKLELGCYESGVPDRFEVKISITHAPNSGVPPGRRPHLVPDPGDKSPGYCRSCLRKLVASKSFLLF
jgi:hypothetical protein